MLIENCSLKELTTWRCGGRCQWLASPSNYDEAAAIIMRAKDSGTKIYTLGGGSNILVQDGLLDAGIIATSALNKIDIHRCNDGVVIEAESGVLVASLLALSIKENLGGLAFLAGIPGTFGGALSGNAGAAGESFAPYVEWVEGFASNGELQRWEKCDLCWKYRTSPWEKPPLFITRACLSLKYTEKDNIIKNIRRFVSLRKGQPIGARTAGCVFKNPSCAAAGLLLDRSGCKGLTIGDARVSNRHANFIENCGDARAEDIYKLTQICRKRVNEQFGIELEYEIKFFGTF